MLASALHPLNIHQEIETTSSIMKVICVRFT
jgi:hypothetical protein